MSDLDAVDQSLQELQERVARLRSSANSETITKPLVDAVAALEKLASTNGAHRPPSADRDVFERNQAELREVIKRLRNGSH